MLASGKLSVFILLHNKFVKSTGHLKVAAAKCVFSYAALQIAHPDCDEGKLWEYFMSVASLSAYPHKL